MKKILCLLIALVMLLSLAACVADTPNNTTGGNDTPSTGGNDTPSTGGNDQPTTGGNDQPTTGGNDDQPIISGDGPTDLNFDSQVSALGGEWNLSKVYVGDTAHDAVANAMSIEITLEEDPYELVDGVAYIHNIVYNLSSKLTFGIDSIVEELEADDVDSYKGQSSWEDFPRGEVVADGGTYKQPGPALMQFRDLEDYGLYFDEIAGIDDDIDTTNKRLIVGMNKAGQLLLGYSDSHIEIPNTPGEWEYCMVFDKA